MKCSTLADHTANSYLDTATRLPSLLRVAALRYPRQVSGVERQHRYRLVRCRSAHCRKSGRGGGRCTDRFRAEVKDFATTSVCQQLLDHQPAL